MNGSIRQSVFGGDMSEFLYALWPLFAMIVSGYLLRRFAFVEAGFWPSAERLNYYFLFPALLFSNLASAPLNDPGLFRQGMAALTGLFIAWGLLLIVKRIRKWPASRFGVYVQGVLRFNTYLGLAVIGSLYGQPGLALAALMLALMVPTVNIMSVWSLTAESGLSFRLLLPVIKNPLILACFFGVLANLSGLGMPLGSDRLLNMLAAASLPLGLLCVGAALKPQELAQEVQPLLGNSLIRLVLMPAMAHVIAWLMRLSTMETMILVLFFGLPTATASYVLTRQLGGNSHLMAGVITVQTLLSGISLIVVLALVS